MGQARFKVSFELLRQSLHMPVGTKILCVSCEDGDIYGECFTTYVEHWELPEVVDGAKSILINPTIHEIRWEWNLPNE